VTAYYALTALGDQSLAALGPRLQTLIARVQSLTRSDPAVSSLLAQLAQPGSATPTVGSLMRRAVLLSLLLNSLTRTGSSAARNLASTLPALHALLVDLLLAANRGAVLIGAQYWRSNGRGAEILRPLVALAPGAGPDTVLARAATIAPAAQGYEQSPAQAASGPTERRSGMARLGPPPTAASVREIRATSAPLLVGGGTGTVNGGMASAVPAAVALLTTIAVWLLRAVCGGRVMLDVFPGRSTLLAARLERPG